MPQPPSHPPELHPRRGAARGGHANTEQGHLFPKNTSWLRTWPGTGSKKQHRARGPCQDTHRPQLCPDDRQCSCEHRHPMQSCHRAAPPQGPSPGATSAAPCGCWPQLHPTDPPALRTPARPEPGSPGQTLCQQPWSFPEHSLQAPGIRTMLENAGGGREELKGRGRALGQKGGVGAEARRAPPWPGHRAAPRIAAGRRGSCSQQFLPRGHSKIALRKNALVFFQIRCKPGNPIQQDLLQQKRLLLPRAAVREVFITLKSLIVRHRKVCPGRAGEGAFRKKARNPPAHFSCPPGGIQARK